MFRATQRVPSNRQRRPAFVAGASNVLQQHQRRSAETAHNEMVNFSKPTISNTRAPRAAPPATSSSAKTRAPRTVSATQASTTASSTSSSAGKTRAPRPPPTVQQQPIKSRAPRAGAVTSAAPAPSNPRSTISHLDTSHLKNSPGFLSLRKTEGLNYLLTDTNPFVRPRSFAKEVDVAPQPCIQVWGEVVVDGFKVGGSAVEKGSIISLYTPAIYNGAETYMRQYQVDEVSGVVSTIDVPISKKNVLYVTNFTTIPPCSHESDGDAFDLAYEVEDYEEEGEAGEEEEEVLEGEVEEGEEEEVEEEVDGDGED